MYYVIYALTTPIGIAIALLLTWWLVGRWRYGRVVLASALAAVLVAGASAAAVWLYVIDDSGGDVSGSRSPGSITSPATPASSSNVESGVRVLESAQGYSVNIPPGWVVFDNAPAAGPSTSVTVLVAPGEAQNLLRLFQEGQISLEDVQVQGSELGDWAAIAVLNAVSQGASLETEAAATLADLERDPAVASISSKNIEVAGNEAVLYYYVGPAPGMTGVWDHGSVMFLAGGRLWLIGITTSRGQLDRHKPAFEMVYGSFRL